MPRAEGLPPPPSPMSRRADTSSAPTPLPPGPEPLRAEQALRARERQQSAVADLGRRALSSSDVDELLDVAVCSIADVLGVEYAKVLQVLPDRTSMLLRSGVGWHEGVVGQAEVSAVDCSQASYTLISAEPVIVEDLRTETRFSGPSLLAEHGVISGLSCLIAGPEDRPWGVLGAHTSKRRTFTHDDVNFLDAMANVLAALIERLHYTQALREREADLHRAQAVGHIGSWRLELNGRRLTWSAETHRILGVPEGTPLHYRTFLALVHPDDRARVKREWRAALKRKTYDIEHRLIVRGETKWVRERAEFDLEPDGRLRGVFGITQDITARKQAEETLAYRFRLTDALRQLQDPRTMQATGSRLLGEHLRVSCVVYFGLYGGGYVIEENYGSGIPEVGARFPFVEFGGRLLQVLRAGEPFAVEDVAVEPGLTAGERATLAELQIRACLAVPRMRQGRLIGGLAVHAAEPRAWTSEEILATRETAERTWAAVDRVNAEAALQASEDRLQVLIDHAPAALAMFDRDMRYLTASRRWLTDYGLSPEGLRGRSHYDVFPEIPERWRAFHHRVLAGETLSAEEDVFRRIDGRALYLHWEARPWRGADGEIGGIVIFTEDITERKRAEKALERNLAETRAIFEQMTEGLVIYDAQGNLVNMNPAALAMHGCSSLDQVPGHLDRASEVWEVFDLAGQPLPREDWPISRALRGETFSAYRIRIRGPQPNREWIGSYGGAPVFGPDGIQSLAVVTLRDVTAQHQLEAALREADRRKDEFLATLAHELRNPLAPLRNGLEILRLTAGTAAGAEAAMEIMDRQLGHMVHLIDDLLDVSRISRGKIRLRRERVPLGEVVRTALEACRPILESRKHQIDFQPHDPWLEVDADAMRLAQVFGNLLNNAAKYTEPGGHIRIEIERSGDEARVRVVDDGIGIPESLQPHVFDLFTQSEAEDGRQGGLGIGLHIVKRLTEMHGGEVQFHSEGLGRGSEFTVRLPLAQPGQQTIATGRSEQFPAPSSSRRILVVDDQRDVADNLAMLLRVMGNDVQTVYDGLAALDLVESFRPEVVILDLGMPGMDGYETARRIRLHRPPGDLVLAALSGWGQEEHRRRTREAGFDHHLVKPADANALRELLEVSGQTS
jgi:PAS domain S-box-containing protein